jgi:hypothetical protein
MKTLASTLLFAATAVLVPALAPAQSTAPGASQIEVVRPFATDEYRIVVPAGQFTRLTVRGQSCTDLDLYVYDENGRLIVSDTDCTSLCIVSWTPRWTGPFFIRVVNRGARSNIYEISMQ